MTIQDVLARVDNLSAFAKDSGVPYPTLRRVAKSGRHPTLTTLRGIERGLAKEREELSEALGAVRAMIEAKR